ncbi:MAG: DUF4274 domain-containing protein [Sphingomonas sp.]|uniref:hypothetical protein n=1 Tax=Sphingomonas sp. TaxID=28214 RepID=UPI0025D1AB20|nr:hypothetical protein [Sphingomonas sp.]MBY0283862.1 DUF4274 domain-containing protein [Sphingomonas sp.]
MTEQNRVPASLNGSIDAAKDQIDDPDMLAFVGRRTPLERHAIARLLDIDGAALAVLKWIAEQADCDPATRAMIFWRLRGVPPRDDQGLDFVDARNDVLRSIKAKAFDDAASTARIAWNGLEAWTQFPLINAAPFAGIEDDPDACRRFCGPFGEERAEPACFAFLDEDYSSDDMFDALWRVHYHEAAVVDWLRGKSADIWLAAVGDLLGSHPDAVFEWMVVQPDCPDAVAARIFWEYETPSLRSSILKRWRSSGFVKSGLDFRRYVGDGDGALADDLPADLTSPQPGRAPLDGNLSEDFIWWVASVSIGGLVERPRQKAEADWQATLSTRRDSDEPMPPPTRAEVDSNYRWLNLITALAFGVTIALWRTGFTKPATIAFIAFLIIIPLYMGAVTTGGFWRTVKWLATVAVASIALAFLFRFIDTGALI